MDFVFHPQRCRNLTRRAGISPDAPPPPPLDSPIRPTPGGGAGRERGGRGAGAGRARGGLGGAAAVPAARAAEGGGGRGAGRARVTGTGGVAWRAPQPPAPPALPRNTSWPISLHLNTSHNVAQYILLNLNTSNTSLIGTAIQPTVHPANFQYIT